MFVIQMGMSVNWVKVENHFANDEQVSGCRLWSGLLHLAFYDSSPSRKVSTSSREIEHISDYVVSSEEDCSSAWLTSTCSYTMAAPKGLQLVLQASCDES